MNFELNSITRTDNDADRSISCEWDPDNEMAEIEISRMGSLDSCGSLYEMRDVEYRLSPNWILRLLMIDLFSCFVISLVGFHNRVTNYQNWSLDSQCYLKSTKTTLNGVYCLVIGILIMLIHRFLTGAQYQAYGMTEVGQFLCMPIMVLIHLVAAGISYPSHVPTALAEGLFFSLLQITIGQCSLHTTACESRLMGIVCILALLMYFIDEWSMHYGCKKVQPASEAGMSTNLLLLFLWVIRATELALTKIKNPKKNILYQTLSPLGNRLKT